MSTSDQQKALIIRHEEDSLKEPSACGHRYRLLSKYIIENDLLYLIFLQ